MSKSRLLLASQSPRRRELLTLLGLAFESTAPDVAEIPQEDESPDASAVRFSQAKARAALSQPDAQCEPDGIVIACDTIVAHEGALLGKPRDAAEATAMLRRLRGQPHAVYSAVTLLEVASGKTVTDLAHTELLMRTYTDAELDVYVSSGDPLDKAGAYGIQNVDFHPVVELRGCYANVMGFPLCHVTRCLRALGIVPVEDVPAACQAYSSYQCAVYGDVLAGRPGESAYPQVDR